MKFTAVCLAALGALALAGCEQSTGSGNSAATPTPDDMTVPSTPAIAKPSSEVPAPAGSPATMASPAGTPRVVVDNDSGIHITPAAGGRTITVAFGTKRAQAQATLVAALGPTSEGMNPDCPWGPATLLEWPAGQAIVVNDELVGWTADEGDFGYTCIAD